MYWLFAAALAQEASPVIREVTVFPDRASVTRTLGVSLAPGLNEVTFADLPPTTDERTLQAAGLAAGARIIGLDVRSRELEEDRRARVAELEARVQDLRDQLTAAQDRDTAATAELTFLQKVGAEAAEQLSAELMYEPGTPKDAESMAGLLRTRVPQIQEAARMARQDARDLEVSIGALERELATVRGSSQWSLKDVTVLVEATAAATGSVDLTYVVPGAGWTPAYDARAESDDGHVALTLNALVVQTTGEDWNDATLSLSTARPSAGVQPPELAPFWLEAGYYYAPEPDYGDYDEMMPSEMEDSAGATREAAEPPPPPMAVATATITERAVATTFEVAGTASVPGDGTRRKVRVTDVEVTSTFVRVAVPRIEAAAYLVAESKWEQAWPLLPGEVSTFLDGAFAGTGHLDTVGPGQDLQLGFGHDDAVRVEVEVTQDLITESGSRAKAERLWTYKITNGRDSAVTLEVRDRVPQTHDAKFKVKPLGDEVAVGAEGAVKWRQDLAAGAVLPIAFGYEVRWPRKHPPGVLP